MSPQERREPEDPSAHIYLNLQELQREVAARSAAPQPHSPPHSPPHSAHWETHRDTESGHLFYYNPSTGETTWDCPFQRGEDAVSPGASPPAWGHRDDSTALPYGSVTGEGLWDPHCVGDGPRDEETGMMPYSPMERRVRPAGSSGVRWGCDGGAVGAQWGCRGAQWVQSGDTVGMQWGHDGDTEGVRWGPNGDSMGTQRGCGGDTVGTQWGYDGDTVGTQWGHSGDTVGL